MLESNTTGAAQSRERPLPGLEGLAPPLVNPRIAALVALGVVDFARSEEGRGRFAELEALDAFDSKTLDELSQLAESLLRAADAFDDARRDPQPVRIPTALDASCRAHRAKLIVDLAGVVTDDPGIAAVLRRTELSYGPRDLACDLRALAARAERHHRDPELIMRARGLALQLEDALASRDTLELREARRTMRRVWAVFEPAYRELATIARELFAESPEGLFPTLDAIATIEREARGRSSSEQIAATLIRDSLAPKMRASVRPRTRPSHPRAESTTSFTECVQLNAESESNLWLGFSQDIAEGGVFIATYVAHPLGAEVALEVQLPGRDETLKVSGIVHWLRVHHPEQDEQDVPPGVGVRLTNLSRETARALQTFAAQRTPIFYDD